MTVAMAIDRRALLGALTAAPVLAAAAVAADARSGAPPRPWRAGAAFYPEQSPHMLRRDVDLMRLAGIEFVRMAEFAWASLEPADGRYDFGWLRAAIAMLDAAGISTILGTPSAAPPPWLVTRHPEILLVAADGRPAQPGARRFTCPTNATYRRYATGIATALSQALGKAAGVIGWQIDNELALDRNARCYCAACRDGFHGWLRARYSELDALNEAWGTAFWSARYGDWAEVPLPLSTAGDPNPGLALDYARFQSDSWSGFAAVQAAAVRPLSPGRFVTSNTVPLPVSDTIALPRLAASLDFLSLDNYPGFYRFLASVTDLGLDKPADDLATGALVGMLHDATRGARGVPHLVTEQQCGRFGTSFIGARPAPGQLRLWALQAVAHGARGVEFFRWDTPRAGQEQYWEGLVRPDRTPSPAFAEITRTIAELRKLGDVFTAPVAAPVALIVDPASTWMLTAQPGQPAIGPRRMLLDWYRALTAMGIGVDIVAAGDDLHRYAATVAPALTVVSPTTVDTTRRYVERGGLFIAGARLGERLADDRLAIGGGPSALAAVMGVRGGDAGPLADDGSPAAGTGALSGLSMTPALWLDHLVLAGATPLMARADGAVVVAENRLGRGRAVTIATYPDRASIASILDRLLPTVVARAALPTGMEMTYRGDRRRGWTFLLNHSGATVELAHGPAGIDAFTGERCGGSIMLPPYGVRVVVAGLHDGQGGDGS